MTKVSLICILDEMIDEWYKQPTNYYRTKEFRINGYKHWALKDLKELVIRTDWNGYPAKRLVQSYQSDMYELYLRAHTPTAKLMFSSILSVIGEVLDVIESAS